MRFVADPEPVVLGLNEEAHVEVQLGRLAAPGRNPVHVDVEDGVVERPHVESGLLARFPQCDREAIVVSVAVTTGLQPAPEAWRGACSLAVRGPVHHTLRNRCASVSFGRSARSGRCPSVSAIHSSSVIAPRAPGVAALRREAIETVCGAGGKSSDLGFETVACILVVCRLHGLAHVA